jgi:hypothetical protein
LFFNILYSHVAFYLSYDCSNLQAAAAGDDAAAAADAEAEDANADNAEDANAEADNAEGEDANAEGDNAAEGENAEGGGRRQLQAARELSTVVYVDCDTCQANGCYNNQNNNGNNNQNNAADGQSMDELVAAWAESMTECSQTDQYWGNYNLYAGFICNAQGTGVEIGVFLDNECEVYTMTKSYKTVVANTDNYNYLMNSQQVVTYPFLNTIDCAAVEFKSPENQNNDDANNDRKGDEDNDGIMDVCEELFNDQGALSINDCNNNGQNDGEEAAADQANDDAAVDTSFYQWTLSQNNADNAEAVCYIIKSFEGEYSKAHVYNDSEMEGQGSGKVYNYNQGSQDSHKGGKIFGIVLLIVVVVAGAVLAVQAINKKRKNEKKTPLMGSKRGAIA